MGKKSPKCLLIGTLKSVYEINPSSFKDAPSPSLGPCQHGTVQYHNHQLFHISNVSHVTTQLVQFGALYGWPLEENEADSCGKEFEEPWRIVE